MTKLEAIAKGYTVQVLIEGDYETHEALVRVNEDYDSVFPFYSLDCDEVMKCHGYNCTIDALED